MKKLSKLMSAAFMAAILFFATETKAQTTPANAFVLSLGIETGIPTGVARLGTNFNLGGTARLQYGITNNFALTFTAGGYHYFPKKIPGQDARFQSYGELPIKAGVREFFLPNVYVGGEVGIAFEKLEGPDWGPRRLDLSPNLGYATKNWDFGIHYDHLTHKDDHLGIFALRVAYGFGL